MSEFIVPSSAAEAVGFKNTEDAYLAGGTEINRLGGSENPRRLIYIGRLGLDDFSYVPDMRPAFGCASGETQISGPSDSFIRIGAASTFQSVVENEKIPVYLRNACMYMASRTKRNMATIGGNIAVARDDSYIWPVLLASRAKLEILTPEGDTRWICSKKYLSHRDAYRNDLILAVLLHNSPVEVFSKRIANTAESHSCLNAAAGYSSQGLFKIACALKGSGIIYLEDYASKASDITEEETAQYFRSFRDCPIVSDMYGSEEYKRYLLGTVVFDLVSKLKEAVR